MRKSSGMSSIGKSSKFPVFGWSGYSIAKCSSGLSSGIDMMALHSVGFDTFSGAFDSTASGL